MKVIVEGDLKELLLTGKSRKYLRGSRTEKLLNGLRRAVQLMMSVEDADELKQFSFLHYERLKYGYSNLSSIRLCNQFVHRLLFEESEDRKRIKLIEIDDSHYGNKKG